MPSSVFLRLNGIKGSFYVLIRGSAAQSCRIAAAVHIGMTMIDRVLYCIAGCIAADQ